MNVKEFLKNNGILVLDGATGSLILSRGILAGEPSETANLTHGGEVERIHREYFLAGANAVTANTFGINLFKYDLKRAETLVAAALEHAKSAAAAFKDDNPRFIGFDVGPSGKMMKPFGDLDFEDAVKKFGSLISLGAKYGADYVFIETFNDLAELKAAVVAAKEVSDLPVFVSMAFDDGGKLLSGSSPEIAATVVEALGADAVGCNCSFGPAELIPVVKRIASSTDLPIIFKPNAGLPRESGGKTVYDVGAEDFARGVTEAVGAGARILGGCCGTTPEYIRELVSALDGAHIPERKRTAGGVTTVCSALRRVAIGGAPVMIGERINPTGKKAFKDAVRREDYAYILEEAVKQTALGADILDVNVGVPETDERRLLKATVESLQAVVDAPLSIDTSDAGALEKALRAYIGKPLVNSVCGKRESIESVFPLVKKYGGAVVCLTLDERGIPETAAERAAIAERIVAAAKSYGIDGNDLVFDALTMAVSADANAATVCLDTLALLKKAGLKTVLGVSNVSFGLPQRDVLNGAFLTMALASGLDAAIVDPTSFEIQKAFKAFALLRGLDPMAKNYAALVERLTDSGKSAAISPISPNEASAETLREAIEKGLKDRSTRLARELIRVKDGLSIINEDVMPALDAVGAGFENKSVYLPQLLMSAECAKAAFEVIKTTVSGVASEKRNLTVIVATVRGDVHDIGKNIVRLLLENYGFTVVDLGKDVSPEEVVAAAIKYRADLVGLSALMTTTVVAMKETVSLLKEKAPTVKTMVGGAVLSEDLAERLGADYYAKDALSSVRIAEELERK